ncbi:MAG TPA: non-homologous end-joining DNA ligase [Woeseiaceae bacterium]|nr:non-homologous end-joining DNA ligase [Woeseiaceae bacterium]
MKRTYGPYTVETSNEDKILYSDAGVSKGDVIDYYEGVYDRMQAHLRDRCLTLERYPDGIDEDHFYQQKRGDHFPDFVGSQRLKTAGGKNTVDHIIAGNRAALVYLADQAALTLHGWLSVASEADKPDRVVFDLDPSKDDDFDTVVLCARILREQLADSGLEPYVMTTGSRGLHVLAPLDQTRSFDEVRKFAKSVATEVAERHPDRITTEQRKKARKDRVYIDINRNAYGQTSVLPYSLRARPGAPAATPLEWDELDRGDLTPQRFGLSSIARRLGQKADPFDGFAKHRRRPKSLEAIDDST